MYEKQHFHGQVNEISEQNGDRDLQEVLRLKIPAQDDELDQDQKKAEGDCELPQCKRKVQVENMGIDEIGDVPRSALVIRLTPSELMKSPIRNTM